MGKGDADKGGDITDLAAPPNSEVPLLDGIFIGSTVLGSLFTPLDVSALNDPPIAGEVDIGSIRAWWLEVASKGGAAVAGLFAGRVTGLDVRCSSSLI
jgi:hypothetical protein